MSFNEETTYANERTIGGKVKKLVRKVFSLDMSDDFYFTLRFLQSLNFPNRYLPLTAYIACVNIFRR